jgi:hypothetical protein
MIECDINDREECYRAFDGAYGVFAITNYWNAIDNDEYKQTLCLVKAAKAANIQHFILSIRPDAEVFERNKFDLSLHSM